MQVKSATIFTHERKVIYDQDAGNENLAATNSNKIPYNGNHPQKKSFVNLEAFANVFLHFLSRLEFLYVYEIA